jgi:hypothetical protein
VQLGQQVLQVLPVLQDLQDQQDRGVLTEFKDLQVLQDRLVLREQLLLLQAQQVQQGLQAQLEQHQRSLVQQDRKA